MLIPPILSFLPKLFFNYVIQLLLQICIGKVLLPQTFKTEESQYCISNPVLLEPPGECTHHFPLLGTPFCFLDMVWLCIIFFNYVLDLYCCHDKLQSIQWLVRFVILPVHKSVTQYWSHWAKNQDVVRQFVFFISLFLLVLAKFTSLRLASTKVSDFLDDSQFGVPLTSQRLASLHISSNIKLAMGH